MTVPYSLIKEAAASIPYMANQSDKVKSLANTVDLWMDKAVMCAGVGLGNKVLGCSIGRVCSQASAPIPYMAIKVTKSLTNAPIDMAVSFYLCSNRDLARQLP